MKRSDLRKSGLRKGVITHYVDHDKELVVFRGKFPGVMAIPKIMESYPGYEHEVWTWKRFNEVHNLEGA